MSKPACQPQRKDLAYLSIASAATCWGIISLFIRRLNAAGLSPMSVVAVRCVGGAVLLSLALLLKDRSVFRVRPRDLIYFVGTGVISLFLFTLFYFTCMELCSVAVAAILLYTAPVFVVVLSALIWKDPITKRKIAALFLALSGCVLVTGLFGSSVTLTLTGFLLGIGSGFFYALYTIFGRMAISKGYNSYTVTLYTFFFGSVCSLLTLRVDEFAAGLRQPGIPLVMLLLVVVSTVTPYLLYTKGLERVESGTASIIACVEPVVATLVSVFVFQEPFTLCIGLGIVCILGAVLILR